MPEKEKEPCGECGGSGVCPHCGGAEGEECEECGSDGKCVNCEGTGETETTR